MLVILYASMTSIWHRVLKTTDDLTVKAHISFKNSKENVEHSSIDNVDSNALEFTFRRQAMGFFRK